MNEQKIYRSIEVCKNCPNFLNAGKIFGMKYGDEYAKFFCKKEDNVFLNNDGEITGMIYQDCLLITEWKKKSITTNCDFYAEYFLKECNK